jgi:hypothetical protein
VCGVWCVVCGVWCVVCGVWCVVCGVWCVVCGVWCVVCGVWCVVCGDDHRHVIMRRSGSAAKGASDIESVASSVSLRERLPDYIQKALAELLEANGGIISFRGRWKKLTTLCDEKFDDDRSSPLADELILFVESFRTRF